MVDLLLRQGADPNLTDTKASRPRPLLTSQDPVSGTRLAIWVDPRLDLDEYWLQFLDRSAVSGEV